ncbi:MAG TPA: type II CAAX endopeptidase family protein [Bacillales bacterium]|nr:type II CAAX endopeptidase family protein [Bacillales bacterium]
MLNRLFVTANGEVRIVWKLVCLILLYIMFNMLLVMPLKLIPLGHQAYQMVVLYVREAAFIAAAYIALKMLDDRRPQDVGLIPFRLGSRAFLIGFALGAGAMIVIFFGFSFSGTVTLVHPFTQPEISWSLINGFLFFFVVAVAEEFFFRGYLMHVFTRRGNVAVPVIMSSVLFALSHAMNPNVAILGLVNIFFVGLLLAWMYVKTGNLWMPIGFHMAWNYFQGNVFGFPVSGTTRHGLYTIKETENVLWSGGSFGPEAGLAATLVLLALTAVIWKMPVTTPYRAYGRM